MGKRSDFERNPRGFYPTPAAAVAPLLPHIKDIEFFDEPCAGDGALIDILEATGVKCRAALDIEPMRDDINCADALSIDKCFSDAFITNPPWPKSGRGGDPALAILMHLSALAPTWLLLPADFAHNVYFGKVESRCRKIVSVGRIKWIPDTKHSGKDNAAWYLFDATHIGVVTFHGRASPG